jgi:hypothetical protein
LFGVGVSISGGTFIELEVLLDQEKEIALAYGGNIFTRRNQYPLS